jgi:hypothetical protein
VATATVAYRATRLFFKEEEIEGSTGGATVALEPTQTTRRFEYRQAQFFFDDWRGKKWKKKT